MSVIGVSVPYAFVVPLWNFAVVAVPLGLIVALSVAVVTGSELTETPVMNGGSAFTYCTAMSEDCQ